jgi:hypothetical protein
MACEFALPVRPEIGGNKERSRRTRGFGDGRLLESPVWQWRVGQGPAEPSLSPTCIQAEGPATRAVIATREQTRKHIQGQLP